MEFLTTFLKVVSVKMNKLGVSIDFQIGFTTLHNSKRKGGNEREREKKENLEPHINQSHSVTEKKIEMPIRF